MSEDGNQQEPQSPGFIDGRQSETALKIQRGAMRHLSLLGYVSVSELTLPNGRRADLVAMSDSGHILILEIKSSRQDFLVDQKWQDYLDFCDSFAFALHMDGPVDLIPEDQGLLICDAYGGEFIRQPLDMKMSAARRKAIYQRIIQHAARRLHSLMDPRI